jgi:hypothetical protein
MIELLVSVCLISEPERCKDVSLVFDGDSVTPMQCMMGAQPEIARWMESHPKWQLKRWACQPAGQIAKI